MRPYITLKNGLQSSFQTSYSLRLQEQETYFNNFRIYSHTTDLLQTFIKICPIHLNGVSSATCAWISASLLQNNKALADILNLKIKSAFVNIYIFFLKTVSMQTCNRTSIENPSFLLYLIFKNFLMQSQHISIEINITLINPYPQQGFKPNFSRVTFTGSQLTTVCFCFLNEGGNPHKHRERINVLSLRTAPAPGDSRCTALFGWQLPS